MIAQSGLAAGNLRESTRIKPGFRTEEYFPFSFDSICVDSRKFAANPFAAIDFLTLMT